MFRVRTLSCALSAVLAFSLLLAGCLIVRAQEGHSMEDMQGHAKYHLTYKGWKTSKGFSCCNDEDCHPIDAADVRLVGEEVEVNVSLWLGEPKKWVKVPPEAIRSYPPPNLSSHICIWMGTVRCFVFGGGM